MNSEARNEDPEQGAVKITRHGGLTGMWRLPVSERDRRGRFYNRTITAIVLVTCMAVPGTAIARMSDSMGAVDTPVIRTAALQTDIAMESVPPSANASAIGASAMDVASQSSVAAEGGPAILWVVALALMAVLWLGRRNDGGV